MANRPAQRLVLHADDRPVLEAIIRDPSPCVALAHRARIVLLAADGLPNTHIAEQVGVTRPTVLAWRHRYAQHGVEGLQDKPHLGSRPGIGRNAVLDASLSMPPSRLGVTHWSSRLLARELGVGRGTVARAWQDYGMLPVRGGFRFRTLPVLAGRVTDVLALRLGSPGHMVLLGVRGLSRKLDPPRRQASTAALLGLRRRLGQDTEVSAGDDPVEALLRFLDELRSGRSGWPSGATLHLVSDGRGMTAYPEVRDAMSGRSGAKVHTVSAPERWPAMAEAWLAMAVNRYPSDARLADLPARFRERIDTGDAVTWVGRLRPATQPTRIRSGAGVPGP